MARKLTVKTLNGDVERVSEEITRGVIIDEMVAFSVAYASNSECEAKLLCFSNKLKQKMLAAHEGELELTVNGDWCYHTVYAKWNQSRYFIKVSDWDYENSREESLGFYQIELTS